MVSPRDPEDDITKPLVDQDNSLTQYSTSTEPLNTSTVIIPTPIGPTTFNMRFVFSLFASLGALLFAGTVWYITSSADYLFFVWHPTLMATVLSMATLGTVILQRAETRQEKDAALNFHKLMQSIAFLSVIGGFYIVYTFKEENKRDHFYSPHGKSGLITFSLILIQSIAGSTLVNFPGVVGGPAKARAMYKYHRFSGYVILPLIWLTALGGTQADWTRSQFDHLWVWLTAAGLVLVGITGRVKSSKLKV